MAVSLQGVSREVFVHVHTDATKGNAAPGLREFFVSTLLYFDGTALGWRICGGPGSIFPCSSGVRLSLSRGHLSYPNLGPTL